METTTSAPARPGGKLLTAAWILSIAVLVVGVVSSVRSVILLANVLVNAMNASTARFLYNLICGSMGALCGIVIGLMFLLTANGLRKGTKGTAAVGVPIRTMFCAYLLTNVLPMLFMFTWLSFLWTAALLALMIVIFNLYKKGCRTQSVQYEWNDKTQEREAQTEFGGDPRRLRIAAVLTIVTGALLAVQILWTSYITPLRAALRVDQMDLRAHMMPHISIWLIVHIVFALLPWLTILLLIMASRRGQITPSIRQEAEQKNLYKPFGHGFGYATIALCVILGLSGGLGMLSVEEAERSSSSSSSSSHICQFDGCTRKAVGPTYEFCSYHKAMLNSYWDYSNAAGK